MRKDRRRGRPHLRIGSGQAGREDRLHNSNYQPDEACIADGVRVLSRTALALLANSKPPPKGLSAASRQAHSQQP